MKLLIGSHVSYKTDTGLLGCVKETLDYNANTFMFYTGAPQNTKRSKINDEITYKAYELMKENNIDLENIIVHAPYIINLCNDNNFDFSVSFLKQEVERCNQLNITKLVLHPGSSVGLERNYAIDNIIKGLNIVLDNNYNVTICLETMAGKGTEVGKTFEEMQEMYREVVRRFNKIELREWNAQGAMIELSKQVGELAKQVMIKEKYYALTDEVPDVDERLGNEMADVIAQVMRLADCYQIDLERAFLSAREDENQYLISRGV